MYRSHQPGRRRRRPWAHPPRTTLIATAAAVTAALLGVPQAAGTASAALPPTSPAMTKLPGGGGPSHQVTLITGDRVTVTGTSGNYTVAADRIAPRPGIDPAPAISIESGADGVYAIPDDAGAAVSAGTLDRELFNVSYLVEHGYTDARTHQLPVLVTYPRAAGRAATTSARTLSQRVDRLPATAAARGLPSVNGAAVALDKRTATQFWHQLRGETPTAHRATTPYAPVKLGAGVARVSLDRMLRVTLAESVPLIGAPQAWNSGYNGTGVTVAVLDSGIDATHPDLAGKVAASQRFIPGTGVADDHGHGTHVASTIVGSGAASDGRNTGVAPGARLVVGKVCDKTGDCPASAIIQGMEWAALTQDADIVSISLGGCCTDGTDPMSQAVDSLTAQTGALFVIAAGNDGPAAQTVGSPGTATSALTVAATDKNDKMARFSSRGPRAGGALKPDIAAPGVAIVAARATGTSMGSPVDAHYTAANGTSMATPHVSGAAAILAQQHPDWRAADLKATLMSTAHDAGHTVYEQGAGRVDVARATRQRVYATTPNLDFGRLASDATTEPVTKELTYRNLGDQPVTLTLTPTLRTVGGTPAPDDALTTVGTLTVPAGGTATATVTLDLTGLPAETFTGTVVATDEAQQVRLSTPVGLDRRVSLTIHVLDTEGQSVDPDHQLFLYALDVGEDELIPTARIDVGRYQALVRPGTYHAHMTLRGINPDTTRVVRAWLIDPQITVTGNTETWLDARQTRPVSIATPRKSVPHALAINLEVSGTDGRAKEHGFTGALVDAQTQVWVTPTERVTVGTFRFSTRWTFANPQVSLDVRGHDLELHPVPRASTDQGFTFTENNVGYLPFTQDGSYEVVDAGFGDLSDIAGRDLTGKLALIRWGDDRWGPGNTPPDGIPDPALWVDRLNNLHDAGAVGVVLYSDLPAGQRIDNRYRTPREPVVSTFVPDEVKLEIPEVQLTADEGQRLRKLVGQGRVVIDLDGEPDIDYTYELSPVEDGQVRDSLAYRFGDRDLARVETSHHASVPGVAASREQAWKPGGHPVNESLFRFAVPQTLTRYFGPVDPDLVRNTKVQYQLADGRSRSEGSSRVFRRAGRTTERWGTTLAAPGAAPSLDPRLIAHPDSEGANRQCSMCREGNVMYPAAATSMTGDHHDTALSGEATYVHLQREDGAEIPLETIGDFLPVFTLPEEPGTYQLTYARDSVSDTTTRWTFHSAAPTRETVKPGSLCWAGRAFGLGPCHPDPFIFLRYDLGHSLRLDNTVAVPDIHGFTVTAYNGQSTTPMPLIAGMRVWTSVDDGQTWKQALVIPRGRGDGEGRAFQVLAGYPALRHTTGAVSLKVEAWDAAGNRVQQVIDRAFALSDRFPHPHHRNLTP